MSNHRAWTWDHRGSKPLGPKLLPLGHHLDGLVSLILIDDQVTLFFDGPTSHTFFLVDKPHISSFDESTTPGIDLTYPQDRPHLLMGLDSHLFPSRPELASLFSFFDESTVHLSRYIYFIVIKSKPVKSGQLVGSTRDLGDQTKLGRDSFFFSNVFFLLTRDPSFFLYFLVSY